MVVAGLHGPLHSNPSSAAGGGDKILMGRSSSVDHRHTVKNKAEFAHELLLRNASAQEVQLDIELLTNQILGWDRIQRDIGVRCVVCQTIQSRELLLVNCGVVSDPCSPDYKSMNCRCREFFFWRVIKRETVCFVLVQQYSYNILHRFMRSKTFTYELVVLRKLKANPISLPISATK